MAGLSFGAILALAFYRRHAVPRSLVLASAYAGWGGSLPPEVADQRLRQAFDLAGLAPDELVGTLLPTMFSKGTAPDAVEALGAAMRAFHPTGLRAMARASAENLRDVLPPDRRPHPAGLRRRGRPRPSGRGQGPRGLDPAGDPGRPPDVGHICNIEAPEAFNRAVRTFLQGM